MLLTKKIMCSKSKILGQSKHSFEWGENCRIIRKFEKGNPIHASLYKLYINKYTLFLLYTNKYMC